MKIKISNFVFENYFIKKQESYKIISYKAEHQPHFDKLNRKWIEDFFVMEPVDEFVLLNPDKAILQNGGTILMAE